MPSSPQLASATSSAAWFPGRFLSHAAAPCRGHRPAMRCNTEAGVVRPHGRVHSWARSVSGEARRRQGVEAVVGICVPAAPASEQAKVRSNRTARPSLPIEVGRFCWTAACRGAIHPTLRPSCSNCLEHVGGLGDWHARAESRANG
jgi:hypothetical protein